MQLMNDMIELLNKATRAYDEGHPIMSDEEWDKIYFQLKDLEERSGVIKPGSPVQTIVFDVVNALEKVEHNHKMLSLDKTKDVNEVRNFVGDKTILAMCKMDGLTCSLQYSNGSLIKAETRGNGLVGENIYHNAIHIPSIPHHTTFPNIVVDGEIICTYTDFDLFSHLYKNPRNFAIGSIRLLDAKECASRHLTFVAWDVISGMEDIPTLNERLEILDEMGFVTVPRFICENIDEENIEKIKELAVERSYPIDGVVFKFNNVAYGASLGETAHHFRNAIAYKFYDETYPSTLKDVEWTMGRTGTLTPVAIFEPVEIDGSVVERASLHNVSIMYETLGLNPCVGQGIEVYKANMIIPQIASADCDFEGENRIVMPDKCPICGAPLALHTENNTRTLVCINPDCQGQLINRLDHFCGKKGLDIKGLSKATLGKLIEWGWIEQLSDLFYLTEHRDEWIKKAGFGEKSVDKILDSIESSRTPSLQAFISSLGIPLIGSTVSKELVKHIKSYNEFREKADNHFDFSQYDGFAFSKTEAIWNFDFKEADSAYVYLTIQEPVEEAASDTQTLAGLNIVITGRLEKYKNRAELQKEIEARGGKVVGAVSGTTNCLINNDNTFTSAKNLAAKKLNIPILTEEEFGRLYLNF